MAVQTAIYTQIHTQTNQSPLRKWGLHTPYLKAWKNIQIFKAFLKTTRVGIVLIIGNIIPDITL